MKKTVLIAGTLISLTFVGIAFSASPSADGYVETVTGREGRRYCIFDDMTWNYALYDDDTGEFCVPFPVSRVIVIRIKHIPVIDSRPAPP